MTSTSPSASPPEDSKRRRARATIVLVGGIVPMLIAVVATILMFGWLPELPDPIAVHWSGSGADGFGPALMFVSIPIIFTVVFSGFAIAWSWSPLPSGRITWNQKVALATNVWLAALLSVGFAGSVAVQRGLSDAHNAPDIGPFLALGAGVGLVLAAGAWWVLPAGESVYASGVEATPVDVQHEERVAWSHSTRLGTAPLIIIVLVIVLVVATVVLSALGSTNSIVPSVVVAVTVAALAATNFWWRVSADHRGLIARGIFGWPRKRIPLESIRSVTVVDVNPTRDFGGWGWRWSGDGRSGVILRSGAGIEVTQTSGKRFVVTVDDATTGAGVLTALMAQRARL